ncbi:MAG: NosD domain-containing protein [Euryarchaeota archaeon]|nr:NosD domain-containing protein [Euryarchaeota archaeon]
MVNPGDSIQLVVDNAKSGDVITIAPGTYTENVLVNQKTDLVIRSYDAPEKAVIAANDSTKNVIFIQNSGNITIEGLSVTGAGNNTAGIYVRNSNYCKVKDNLLHDDALGIHLSGSNYAVVSNNTATKNLLAGQGRAIILENSNYAAVSGNKVSNNFFGISISKSRENTVSGNTVSLSANNGIVLFNTNKIVLENNNVNSNSNFGIYLSDSNENTLKSNTVFNSTNGINLVNSSRNEILSNTVSKDSISPGTHAIFMNTSHYNVLQSNVVSNNEYGIAMRYSNGNNVLNNTVSSNNRGIYLTRTSSSNTLSGNLVNSNALSGIILERSSNNNNIISNTAKSNNGFSTSSGIILSSSDNNNIANNDVSENRRGISITSSASGNTVSGNAVNSNSGYGILLETSGINNNLTSNTVSSNGGYGIYLVNSSKTYILNNVVSSNDKGIYVTTSHGCDISYNTALNNNNDGIMLSLSNDNIISGNTADHNNFGISLNSSQQNEVSGNRVTWSTRAGMFLCSQSTNNLIFNNYLSNSVNVDNKNNECRWNTTITPGRNIAGGPNLGGNYWADPINNVGHSQIYANNDTDGDGLIDVIYNGYGLTDYHPLLEVYLVLPAADFTTDVISGPAPLTVQFTDLSQNAVEWNWDFGDGTSSPEQNPQHIYTAAGNYTVALKASNINGTASKTAVITVLQDQGGETNLLPVADFSTSVTGGYAPLSVTFTDLSQGATSRFWDFGDGSSSDEQNPTHIYYSAGTYTVTLTASGMNGTTSKTAQIIVDRESSGGSRGGSSGGGGGGGSPEPARNVEVKELSQVFVANGKTIQFDFTKNATCVVYVGFDAKKTVGKTTTISEQLKNKSSLVSEPPAEEVYRYFNVWVGNSGFATSNNIEKPTICFKVEKSWVQDKKIDQSSIALNRYSDKKWEQLPANLLKEDSKYLYFTADVPGYTFFAVTGKETTIPEESAIDIEPDENKPDSSKDNEEDIESGASTESNEGDKKRLPGFEIVYGIAALSAALLYKRK